jgi:DNA adenine methylase
MPLSRPFLRWPGGKRWLVPTIRELLKGVQYERYIEPFLGGGAMFFGLAPVRALLADVNDDLMNVYRHVRERPGFVIAALKKLPVDATTYSAVRADRPMLGFDRAVRFLYLNRTAFAGMYRLNREGEFNVPFGGGERTPELLWRDDLLRCAAVALASAELITADFETVLARTGEGDLVYCDPTYTVTHNQNCFVRYNERNFRWADQERLAAACTAAAKRGAIVLVSNAAHPEVLALYRTAAAYPLERRSLLCPLADKRRMTGEVLFMLPSTVARHVPTSQVD